MTMSRQAVWARSRAAPSFIRSSWRESVMAESSLSLFQSPFSCRRRMLRSLARRSPLSAKTWSSPSFGSNFDLYAKAGLPPWFVEEFLLELAQPAFGRANEITRRRIGGAHLGKNLFGGHAAIHQPDTLGLAVLGFDTFQKALQRRLVGGMAWQHLIGQGQAVRRDDQGG